MQTRAKLTYLLLLLVGRRAASELNFYMDRSDVLEIKYDLLLKKNQPIHHLEAETDGPIHIHMPTDFKTVDYSNVDPTAASFKMDRILDMKDQDHHVFYLYR